MTPLLQLATGNDGRDYASFLREKVAFDRSFGFEVTDADLHPVLKPHQAAIVKWAIAGGRRAIFARFGLGKSVMQLQLLHLALTHAASKALGGRALVVAPLRVHREFVRDAREHLGIEARFIRRTEQVDPDWSGIYVTNYESVRDERLDVSLFDAVSLDEAAVLASFGSDTAQAMLAMFADTTYRWVATATPSPNEHLELINYATFLGIMDRGAALTRFFQRNSEKAGELTLYPHKEAEFWLWLNTWACFLQRPSDLGFSDDGYELPPLDVQWHEVAVDVASDHVDRDGQGRLFRGGAMSSIEAAREKRETMGERIARAMQIVEGYEHFGAAPGVEPGASGEEPRGDQRTKARTVRGGSGTPSSAGREDSGVAGGEPREIPGAERSSRPGGGDGQIARVVRSEQGSGRRDESAQQAPPGVRVDSGGIRIAADSAAGTVRHLWSTDDVAASGSRSLDGEGARSPVPPVQLGAGPDAGQYDGAPSSDRVLDQLIIWCDLNAEQEALERALTDRGISFSSVHGGLTDEEAERRLDEWCDRQTAVLVGKPVMLGQGMNLQQCNKSIWVGVTYKFRQVIQSLHRVQRFGQSRPVEAHFIYAETESEVRDNLQAKWDEHDRLTERMADLIREHGLSSLAITTELTRAMGVERQIAQGPGWLVALNDCVPEMRDHMGDCTVDLIVTSIPFGNHYEYSLNYADFGHTDDYAQFWWQMDYATPEALRILKPGRIMAVHVKDRIQYGKVTGAGLPTVEPFHAQAIAHYTGHGFDYAGMITIETDVVRENNQTYRLGYSEMLKDGSKMGVGSPEYLLIFHKPQSDRSKGWADDRITKMRDAYGLGRWQIDADAKWRSSGDRLLTVDELIALDPSTRARVMSDQMRRRVYDYAEHVRLADALKDRNALPATFAAVRPGAWSPWVWDDVNRMATLNSEQSRRALEFHVCPLQFDIVDRCITRWSNEGDLVFDPFGGLGTVPLRARKLGRRGAMSELNPVSYRDAVMYQREADQAVMPSLFDLLALESGDAA